MKKKKPLGKNELLEADLEKANGLLSTRACVDMLRLEHKPEHNLAGNMYWSALREIIRLRKLLDEKQ